MKRICNDPNPAFLVIYITEWEINSGAKNSASVRKSSNFQHPFASSSWRVRAPQAGFPGRQAEHNDGLQAPGMLKQVWLDRAQINTTRISVRPNMFPVGGPLVWLAIRYQAIYQVKEAALKRSPVNTCTCSPHFLFRQSQSHAGIRIPVCPVDSQNSEILKTLQETLALISIYAYNIFLLQSSHSHQTPEPNL